MSNKSSHREYYWNVGSLVKVPHDAGAAIEGRVCERESARLGEYVEHVRRVEVWSKNQANLKWCSLIRTTNQYVEDAYYIRLNILGVT